MRLCLSRGVGRGEEVGYGFSLGESRVEYLRGGRRRASCSMGVFHLGCHVRRGWERCRSSVRSVWEDGGDVEVVGSDTVVGDVDAAYGGAGEVRRMYVEGGKQSGLGLYSLGRRM